MEQSLADLLTGAFAEASVPSFLDGDLDFESLNSEEELEEYRTGMSHESTSLHQEAASQTSSLSSMESKYIYMAENVNEELSDETNSQGLGGMSGINTQEEGYTSSAGASVQEGCDPGYEEEEEEDRGTGEGPGISLASTYHRNEFCDGDKEDRIFAKGQHPAPEATEKPQVRNEEQGESWSDEDASYFERVPEHGSRLRIKGDVMGEDEQESEEEQQEHWSDSESKKAEENVLSQCFEQEATNPDWDGPGKASLVQNLQDLIAVVESEEYVVKMKDFSGEEHQEAGESFAEYPSDFSSCEYVGDRGEKTESNHQSTAEEDTCQEGAVADARWMERGRDSDEAGQECLYSIDLQVAAESFSSQDETDKVKTELVERVSGDTALMGCETGDSCSFSSTDDEAPVNRSNEELYENVGPQELENIKQQEELHGRYNSADININWNPDKTFESFLSDDLLTTEQRDKEKGETLLSVGTHAEGVSTHSMTQRGETRTTSPSNQGSSDDSFFFNPQLEASEFSVLGQLGNDVYEEERNWEQEQERIKAFNEFYDDMGGLNGQERRQKKVQFCVDRSSHVIHYETDSSDRDSLSSFTDGEEERSSAETSEELRESEDSTEIKPACDPQITDRPETVPDLYKAQTWKPQCVNMLKATLKMGAVTVMGFLMFWLVTEQKGWLSQILFF